MVSGSERDEVYGLQDLAEEYHGIKTLEHMVRRTIERKLPEELAPAKLNLASRISRSESNAYAKSYEEWEIELPVGNEGEISASMPAVIAEEVGHNTEKGITDNQIDTEKDDWEYVNTRKIYEEALGAHMRELVFEDNIEPFLEKREEQFRTVEEYYETQAIDEIQESIPLIKKALENAWGSAKETESELDRKIGERFKAELQEAYDVADTPDISESDSELRNPVEQYIGELGAPPAWASGHEPTQFDHTFAELEEVLDRDQELSKEQFRESYSEIIERNKKNVKKEVIETDQAHLVGRRFYHNLKESEHRSPEELLAMSREEVSALRREFKRIAKRHGINDEMFTAKGRSSIP